MPGRSKTAAPPAAAAKGVKKRGSKVLALAAGLLVMLLVSIWLGGRPANIGRVDTSTAPSIAVGMAVFAAVLVWAKKLTWPAMIGAFLASVVAAGLVVGQGWQPGLGRGMAKLGAMLPPNVHSCDPAPAGRDRVTSPGGRQCVLVRECPDGQAPQWRPNDTPTGRCVREATA